MSDSSASMSEVFNTTSTGSEEFAAQYFGSGGQVAITNTQNYDQSGFLTAGTNSLNYSAAALTSLSVNNSNEGVAVVTPVAGGSADTLTFAPAGTTAQIAGNNIFVGLPGSVTSFDNFGDINFASIVGGQQTNLNISANGTTGAFSAGGATVDFNPSMLRSETTDGSGNVDLGIASPVNGATNNLLWNPSNNDFSFKVPGSTGTSIDLGVLPSGTSLDVPSNNLFQISNSGGQTIQSIQLNNDDSFSHTIINADNTVVDDFNALSQQTSSNITYTAGGYSTTVYSTGPNPPWIAQTTAFNLAGNRIGVSTYNNDGSTTDVTYDPASQAQRTSTTTNASGTITSQTVSTGLTYENFSTAVVDTLATQLISQLLIKNDLPASFAAEAFASAVIQSAINQQFSDFNTNLAISAVDIAGGLVGSEIGGLFAKDLGLPPEVGTVIGGVAGNVAVQAAIKAEASGVDAVIDNSSQLVTSFAEGLAGAAGGIAGSELADLIEPPTLAGEITGAVATAAATIGIALAGLDPVVGALYIFGAAFGSNFIGNLVGDVISGIFSGNPSVGPNATAWVQYQNGQFVLGQSGQDNGGNGDFARSLATSAASTLNSINTSIGGSIQNQGNIPVWGLGYFGGSIFATNETTDPNGYSTNTFGSSQDAISNAAFNILKSEQIVGGNPYMIYMLQASPATTLAGLVSDLNVARDYSVYIVNPAAFNLALAVSGNATAYNNWVVELARAQALGLDQLSHADLAGFQQYGLVPLSVAENLGSPIGQVHDFFQLGGTDTVLKSGTGQLSVYESYKTTSLVSGSALWNPNGTPFTVSSDKVLLGAGYNFYNAADNDLYFKTGSGQVFVYGITSLNVVSAPYGLYNAAGTAPFTMAAGAVLLGEGKNFYGLGENDLYTRDTSGQVEVAGFNSSGEDAEPYALYNTNGSIYTIASTATFLGLGNDFYNASDKDLIFRDSSGQVEVAGINSSNQVLAPYALFNPNGSAFTLAAGTMLIGEYKNFYGTSENDLILRESTGQVDVAAVNSSNQVTGDFPLWNPATNTGFTVPANEIILGVGRNFYGTGENDLFFRDLSGQVEVTGVNAANQVTAPFALFNSDSTALYTIGASTTFLGLGSNFYGSGEKDIFFRQVSGQVDVTGVNSSNQVVSPYSLWQANGTTPYTVAATASFLTEGKNFYGAGETDVLFRDASGQVEVAGFNSSGDLTQPYALFLPNGQAYTVAQTATFLSIGKGFYGGGENDLFYRDASGQVEVAGVNSSNQVVLPYALYNYNGSAAFAAAQGSTIVETAQGFLGTGGHDLFVQAPTGQITVDEFNGNNELQVSQAALVLTSAVGGGTTFSEATAAVNQGVIIGFDGLNDAIDITDHMFTAQTTVSYSPCAGSNNQSGILTVADTGGTVAKILIQAGTSIASFNVQSDGANGILITIPRSKIRK